MATLKSSPSASLLRALSKSSTTANLSSTLPRNTTAARLASRAAAARRPFSSSATCRDEQKQKGAAGAGGDFRGQLYESTAQRLERERAEQRKYAEERGESVGGRNAALTFGNHNPYRRAMRNLALCDRNGD